MKTLIRRLLNQFCSIRSYIFSNLEVIFNQSELPLPSTGKKHSLAGFETSFTAIAVLFLALWRLLRVNQRFHCQVTSIKGIVAKIRAQTFILRLWNQFYSIHCSIFWTFECIFRRSNSPLPRYWWKSSISGFETGFTALAVLILELWRLLLVDWRYRCQDSGENVHSPSFENSITAFAVLFFTLWMLFLVDWRYYC